MHDELKVFLNVRRVRKTETNNTENESVIDIAGYKKDVKRDFTRT